MAALGGPQELELALFGTLSQIAVIVVAARSAGVFAEKIGQSRAVGEIVVGILLGPSLFGWLFPGIFHQLFHSSPALPVQILSQIGLLLLMFQIGTEFDFSHLRHERNLRRVIAVAAASLLLPFLGGLAFGLLSADRLAPGIHPAYYALFVATAMAVTALPILGRIMIEFDLTRSRIGVLAISAAAITDVVCWLALAAVVATVRSGFAPYDTLWRLAQLLALGAACWWLVRPAVVRFAQSHQHLPGGHLHDNTLALLLMLIFAAGMATYKIGVFAIFGGFLVGAVLFDQEKLIEQWRQKVVPLVNVFLLPIFFTFTGLRTDIRSLADAEQWAWLGAVLLIAIGSKLAGCYFAARATGLGHGEARVIAVMMNTRALMELVVLNVGYDLGVLPTPVFTMLVIMAVLSTVMTSPLLRRFLPALKASTGPIGAGTKFCTEFDQA